MIYNKAFKEDLYHLVEKLRHTESPDAKKIMFEVLDKVSIMVLGENKCANTNMQ